MSHDNIPENIGEIKELKILLKSPANNVFRPLVLTYKYGDDVLHQEKKQEQRIPRG